MTQVDPDPVAQDARPGWRETIEADPLGLVTHRHGEAEESGPAPSQQRELIRLVAGVAVLIGLGFLAGYGETVLVVLALIACIVAHEAGHFFAAQRGGVKVTEFFVGFGPRVWSVRRGETEYGVKALPLGGYCRIIGMNNLDPVDPSDEPRTYRSASLGRRLLIDVAGSTTHFVIALLVLFSMFFWTGDNGNYLTDVPASNPIIAISGLASGSSPGPGGWFPRRRSDPCHRRAILHVLGGNGRLHSCACRGATRRDGEPGRTHPPPLSGAVDLAKVKVALGAGARRRRLPPAALSASSASG